MASHLFIIEAPGKRKSLSDVLWRAGWRDFEVLATAGHLAGNPEGLFPLGVSRDFRETGYGLKASHSHLASSIRDASTQALSIFLATDDDQEGDVIARDVMRFCMDQADHVKVKRVRLKALAPSEIQSAMAVAEPFDPMSAVKGDARRVIDRLLGALSGDRGAVGRVQGSTLLAVRDQVLLAGVATFTMDADDGKGCWQAIEPVYAGQAVPDACHVPGVMGAGKRSTGALSNRVMNHDDIVLSASIETGASIREIDTTMQKLYERGAMTYPRAKDVALSPDSYRRLQMLAKISGTGFDPALFRAIREIGGREHGHEAPNPMVLDVPVNRRFDEMDLSDQVLVHVARNLLNCGVEGVVESPRLSDLCSVPPEVAQMRWHRVVPSGTRLWVDPPVQAGFRPWTAEQSLLHLMIKNDLGRPSTIVDHVEKFLSRDLVDQRFELTEKGAQWASNISEVFGDQNISRIIERYIDDHRNEAATMVAEMVELCGLKAVDTMIGTQSQGLEEGDEISSGYVY